MLEELVQDERLLKDQVLLGHFIMTARQGG